MLPETALPAGTDDCCAEADNAADRDSNSNTPAVFVTLILITMFFAWV
jgi:hypothetical protein